jgi:threonine dehydrogenase-like Zn-dependent dehydrogenase
VLDRATDGIKPRLVGELGATYHSGPAADVVAAVRPDVVIEATGASSVIFDAMAGTAPYAIVCLTGVSPAGRRLTVDAGALNREIVLENDAVIGSVSAGANHYRAATQALARADIGWLERLISRRLPMERFAEAFTPHPDDVKVVIALDGSA